MRTALRRYLGLILALAVALTAHNAAALQGSRDAAGQMVICTGTGPVVVYVDSEGQPTKPPHNCPDCVMHLLDAVAPSPAAAAPLPAGHRGASVSETARGRAQQILRATARGPPAAG
ncbi:hypothetical protein RA19_03540 [Leisingera sp. ANG-M1]|uniref:DUF2946 family protein n=1 Tax=Leisingera sp. ANG-M1 TaxID=1577895 RepID=UPI00057E32EC|nr:hypothetical protein [Leisingera sp. ANG-M1]KIC12316.1 hypothetical protein RA19_03540 [Leisingera sp. ANG-M1]